MLPRKANAKALPGTVAANQGRPARQAAGEVSTAASASPVSADSYLPQISPEAKARLRAFEEKTRKIRELGSQDPEAVSRLMQVWLSLGHEEPESTGDTPDEKP